MTKLQPIITSLLENDAYKFSMGQVFYHQMNNYRNRWAFKCRNTEVRFSPDVVDEITAQLKLFCSLRFTESEIAYLHSIHWLKWDYVEYLRSFTPNFNDFTISLDEASGHLDIVFEGPLTRVSMYEIPLLAIVNETYFRLNYNYDSLLADAKQRLADKVSKLKSGVYTFGPFSDFGLRRRLSSEFQDYAVSVLVSEKYPVAKFVGTSNVHLAMKYGIKPIGTMAHEFIMNIGQADIRKNPAYSNRFAMETWTREYGRLLGTMLTDTIGDKYCLADMGYTWTAQFSGVRHDSGDPIEWGNQWLAHYEHFYKKYADEQCNPKIKTLLFSDNLNFQRASDLYAYFHDKCKVAFGIGTYLMNDTSVEPLNIVAKPVESGVYDLDGNISMHPIAKISNSPGKNMCRSKEYIDDIRLQLARRDKFDNLEWN